MKRSLDKAIMGSRVVFMLICLILIVVVFAYAICDKIASKLGLSARSS